MARPESLHTTLSPRPASASMPACQRARSSSEFERGHPVCSTTTTDHRSRPAAPPPPRADRDGSSARTAGSAPAAPEHSASGTGPMLAPIGRTPRKREAVICRSSSSMASATVSVGGRPPMMASGPPLPGVVIELDGLLDRVTTGGGGDVDELLDVPPGRLGPVGVDIEAAVHPRRITGPPCGRMRQVRVPVGAGRVPEVHVGVDDAGGLGGHQASMGGGPAPDDLPQGGVEPIGDGRDRRR
jgi:hypothetical protein